jgi:hypothetical protein
VVLIDARCSADWVGENSPEAIGKRLGLPTGAAGLISWDVFDAVLTPGDIMLLTSWKDREAAAAFTAAFVVPSTVPSAAPSAAPDDGVRLRSVRVVRDYGMFDRRESPQHYPPVDRKSSGSP